MEKYQLELLQNLVSINKVKYHLLEKIAKLESLDKSNYTEWKQQTENYQLVYDTYHKIKKKCYDIDKNEWIELLSEINHYSFNQDDIPTFLVEKHEYLPIIRTMLDCGLPLTQFYQERSKMSDPLLFMYTVLGITEQQPEDTKISSDTMNQLISYDILHTVFYNIETELENNVDQKELLTLLKYRLILIVPELELNIIRNHFKPFSKPPLIDNITLKSYGLSQKDYESKLDIALECNIKTMWCLSSTKHKSQDLTKTYHIFIKSLFSLIEDKEFKSLLLEEIKDNIEINKLTEYNHFFQELTEEQTNPIIKKKDRNFNLF